MFQHPARLSIDKLLAECDIRRQRRGGPGGQHRNKVETAVIIVHRPTRIEAEANERRSQAENHAQAVARLRTKLAVAVRSPANAQKNSDTSTSALWQQRCAGGRIAINTSHEDFPALLAEALDAVAAADFDVSAAALRLSVSASQLARFLQQEPTAWSLVNDSRRARGLRPLH
ncbi:MAG: peptide chain release factor-like protein [Pirellulales bacterium]